MLRRALPLVLAALVIAPALAQDRIVPHDDAAQRPAAAQATYFPERLDWQHKKPEDVGMNPALVNEAVKIAIATETQGPKDMALFLHSSFGKEPFSTHRRPDQGPRRRQRHHHPQRLHRRRVGRPETRRHHQQRHQDLPDDRGRPGVAEGDDQRRQRLRRATTCRRTSICSTPSTTRRSNGITCCGRRATGRARCGASRTGPTVRWARSRRTGRTASCGSRARTSNTTTCA